MSILDNIIMNEKYDNLVTTKTLNALHNTNQDSASNLSIMVAVLSASYSHTLDVNIPTTGKNIGCQMAVLNASRSAVGKSIISSPIIKGFRDTSAKLNKDYDIKYNEYILKKQKHDYDYANFTKTAFSDPLAQDHFDTLVEPTKPNKPYNILYNQEPKFALKELDNNASTLLIYADDHSVLKPKILNNFSKTVNGSNVGNDIGHGNMSLFISLLYKELIEIKGILRQLPQAIFTSTRNDHNVTRPTIFEQDIIDSFNEKISRIMQESHDFINKNTEKTILYFSNEAHDVFMDFASTVRRQTMKHKYYYYERDHAFFLIEAAAKLAALIHWFENETNAPISLQILNFAIDICYYHFSREYMDFFAPIIDSNLQAVWDSLSYEFRNKYEIRRLDVTNYLPNHLHKKSILDDYLSELQNMGFIEIGKYQGTRQNSIRCIVNPDYNRDIRPKTHNQQPF